MWPERVAVLLDGEFVRKRLSRHRTVLPTAEDILSEVDRMRLHPDLSALPLYRVYYYTADPLHGMAQHPMGGPPIDLASGGAYDRGLRLIHHLENAPDVAVRRGQLVWVGWELGRAATRRLLAHEKDRIEPGDIVPNIEQKGVDMRIGLDIASIALKRLASTIVLVTGDSDLVPAMRFARREGLRVYLDTLGATHVRQELKAHADRVIG
jgi:hypothetical protein